MISATLRADESLSARILDAMDAVPRAAFLDPEYSAVANAIVTLPIGRTGQVASDPRYIARMLSAAITPDTRSVLEIGTGSGWQTAVLLALGLDVSTIERRADLFESAALRTLPGAALRYGDGLLGWPERSPFDAIIVCAGVREIEDLAMLCRQLALGGVIVAPVGSYGQQWIMRGTGTAKGTDWAPLFPCKSVPLERGIE